MFKNILIHLDRFSLYLNGRFFTLKLRIFFQTDFILEKSMGMILWQN